MLNSYHIYFASHYGQQYYDNMAVYYFAKRSCGRFLPDKRQPNKIHLEF